MKDSYGNEVTQLARPLPVEYLLVDMPAAFPLSAQYTFKAHLHTDAKLFPVEYRQEIGETQVFHSSFESKILISTMKRIMNNKKGL